MWTTTDNPGGHRGLYQIHNSTMQPSAFEGNAVLVFGPEKAEGVRRMGSGCCKKRGAKRPEDPPTGSTQVTDDGFRIKTEVGADGYIRFNKIPISDRTEDTQREPASPPASASTLADDTVPAPVPSPAVDPTPVALAPFPVTEDETTGHNDTAPDAKPSKALLP